MARAVSAGVLGLVAACAVTPALAVPTAYDIAFVSEFADACVPQRLSYEGTQQQALAEGWVSVERTANAELDTMMAISEAAAKDPELIDASYDYRIYSKPIEGQTHFLVVSRAGAAIEQGEDPWILIGCYLYNFDAAAPIDPEPVTALIGQPIANSQVDMHIASWLWGPPCPMPRTGDTYMTFIPEVSQYKEQVGFTGLVLKFSTSEPDPGEVVPDTYC
jgi:hypothetical protein